MIASELEKMGIASAGIETVQLDLWNSEIKVGVQSAALVYDLNNLFHKELLVEALVVEGVDIVILRDEEGTYTINGVSPAQVLEQTGAPEASEEESGDEWVAGVVDLKVRNSHLLLRDYTGGTLALEIEELVLNDLNTWAPNQGGDFVVKMALNDIGLEFEGEIRPFAEPISLSIRGGVHGATLAKLSKFTGPLGLARQDAVPHVIPLRWPDRRHDRRNHRDYRRGRGVRRLEPGSTREGRDQSRLLLEALAQ
jgi:hypothetical protein